MGFGGGNNERDHVQAVEAGAKATGISGVIGLGSRLDRAIATYPILTTHESTNVADVPPMKLNELFRVRLSH